MENKNKYRELNDHTIIKNEDTVPVIAFKSLENIEWLGCGFSTRLGGVSKGEFSTMNMSFTRGDNPEAVHENIRLFANSAGFDPKGIVMPHQCHTTNVQIVGNDVCGRGVYKAGTEEEIDGQITNEKGVVLYCLGADCVPVFLADIEKKVISACHAGWRGTVDDIVGNAINIMKDNYCSDPKDIKSVIGPSICMNCYEVSEDVAGKFIDRYSEVCKHIKKEISDIVRPASGSFSDNPTGKFYLNLWEANRVNLVLAGLDEENIEISGYCTKCHPDMLFSHRYHGDARGVNIGYIFIKRV